MRINSLYLIVIILSFSQNTFSQNRWQYDNFNLILYKNDIECDMKNIFFADMKNKKIFLKKYPNLEKEILKNRIKLCYSHPSYKAYKSIIECENNKNDEICKRYGETLAMVL
jgi:hypothetical protein